MKQKLTEPGLVGLLKRLEIGAEGGGGDPVGMEPDCECNEIWERNALITKSSIKFSGKAMGL